MYDKVKYLCDSNGITIKKLEQILGFGNGSIGKFKTHTPTHKKIAQIAEYFSVPLSYFYGDDKDRGYTANEDSMIKKYRALDRRGQETVMFALNNETARLVDERDRLRDIIALPKSRQAAAAGTGVYLGVEDMECVLTIRNDLTKRAQYIIPVSGDSMEPELHDGDLLLIEMESPEIGEIGIFLLDGCGYVKKRGETHLISLNTQYPPIPITQDTRCFGRVICTLNPDWII